MEKLVVPVVGPPRAGKSSVLAHLAIERGFDVIDPSLEIKKWAARNNFALGPRNSFAEASRRMREENPDIILNAIRNSPSNRIGVNAPRVLYEATAMKSEFGAVMLALACDLRTCYERDKLASDKPGVKSTDFDEFCAKIRAEERNPDPHDKFGVNTLTVIEMADFTMDSSGTKEVVCATAVQFVDFLEQSRTSQQG
jgi:hypothetical protein